MPSAKEATSASTTATVAAEWGDSHRLAIPPMRKDWATQGAALPVGGQSAASDFGSGVQPSRSRTLRWARRQA
jgi:hypothetical protein